jgi:hypothetical protein
MLLFCSSGPCRDKYFTPSDQVLVAASLGVAPATPYTAGFDFVLVEIDVNGTNGLKAQLV